MLLVQALAFAAVPVVPAAMPAAPCHGAVDAEPAAASPCCDEPGPCMPSDCELRCARIAMPSLFLPAAPRLMPLADVGLAPRADVEAVPWRRARPPLPPPILA